MALETLDATVVATYPLTPQVQQLVVRVPGHTFTHDAGQHVSVRYDDEEGPQYRPYSPVNTPGSDTLIFAVKRYDEGTCSVWLHERTPGDEISLLPPSGNLRLRNPERDVAFLATGTGVTPMLAMLATYAKVGTGRAVLLFGERAQVDLMYRATLDHLAASHSNLSVRYVLSDESWNGPSGYVQDHLSFIFDNLEAPHAYVCGVPKMVVETRAALEKRGLPPDSIFSEGWEEGALEE